MSANTSSTPTSTGESNTLCVALRQFEEKVGIVEKRGRDEGEGGRTCLLDSALDPTNSLVVLRSHSKELSLFDVSGTHGGHHVAGFKCSSITR